MYSQTLRQHRINQIHAEHIRHKRKVPEKIPENHHLDDDLILEEEIHDKFEKLKNLISMDEQEITLPEPVAIPKKTVQFNLEKIQELRNKRDEILSPR